MSSDKVECKNVGFVGKISKMFQGDFFAFLQHQSMSLAQIRDLLEYFSHPFVYFHTC